MGHAVRVVTDDDPKMTVFSIDGIGAYDHVYRASILAKMHEVPSLRPHRLTHGNRRVGGLMKMGQGIRSGNKKEGNKGTPSCPFCSV